MNTTTKEDRKMSSTPGRILEQLQGGPAKVAVLCRKLELGETTVRTTLKGLVELGMVRRTDAGLFEVVPQEPEKPAEPKARQSSQKANATSERDDQALRILQDVGQISREELAEKMGVSSSLAYLSLYRLRRDGKIKQVHIGTRTPDWAIV